MTLTWLALDPAPTGGYRVYYSQAGKYQFIADVPADTLSHIDTRLQRDQQFTG